MNPLQLNQAGLRRLDLNLLVIFEAVVTAGSVSGAAGRLGMTQSAVSHALGRARAMFGDPLFVRTARGMEPTNRARRLAEAVRAALLQLQDGLGEESGFDPATSVRGFTLRLSDYLAVSLLPPLAGGRPADRALHRGQRRGAGRAG